MIKVKEILWQRQREIKILTMVLVSRAEKEEERHNNVCAYQRERRGTNERHNRTHKITFVEAQIADAHI